VFILSFSFEFYSYLYSRHLIYLDSNTKYVEACMNKIKTLFVYRRREELIDRKVNAILKDRPRILVITILVVFPNQRKNCDLEHVNNQLDKIVHILV
jgi:hypothetical protein